MIRLKDLLGRLWPKRLMGQTILLLILALLSAQIVSAFILRGETRSFYRGAEIRFLAERVSPVASLMRKSPATMHDQLARAFSSRHIQFWLTPESAIPEPGNGDDEDDDRKRASELTRRIADELDEPNTRGIRVYMRHDGEDEHRRQKMQMTAATPRRAAEADTVTSIAIGPAMWVNAAITWRPPRNLLSPDSWLTFIVTAVAISIIVVFVLRRITRPLGRLSAAAGKLGRGERVAPLAEEGPADVRETIHAFNEMQERLRKFVGDRTRMLAAVSHDLRTPITSLRLRAEMVDDAETQERMIATLDEMQKMVEATIAFARAESTEEETRRTDIGALLGAIADDLGDLGMQVTCSVPGGLTYACRPTALRRALSNLIENAARYGTHADVIACADPNGLIITIDDNGPGIAESDLERVFEPFVRLEESRNTETGGIGLGMAIARDIVRRHGGDIALTNRSEGGLRVTVTLPPAESV